jgi:chromodomain-helicase-DNA-binding protein 1
MVLPPSEVSSVTPLPNGYSHMSSYDDSFDQEDTVITDVDSEELSDPENHAVDDSAADDASRPASSATGNTNFGDSTRDSGIDTNDRGNSRSFTSDNAASPGSTRGIKRKTPDIDEVEFMRQNPELYGLRRSTRSRMNRRQIIESASDSDSDAVAARPKRRRRNVSEQTSKRPSRSVTRSSPSDPDSDEYGGRRARASRLKHRRQLQAASADPLLPAEVRFSSRNATKVKNYNEESDDDMLEDGADGLTPNYWVNAVEDDRPAVDMVLDHRFKESFDPKKHRVTRDDCEFYIKWQNKSHYHATWETAESLANCRSTRRVDNYFRKVVEDVRLNNDPDVPPEEKEKWNLDRERDIEAIDDYKKVERIIARRAGEDGPEYFVKWKRLFYDSCTWESEVLVKEIALQEMDRFLDRSTRQVTCYRKEMVPATRSQFEPMKNTPSFLQNGELKEFQVKGLNFLAFNWVRNRNVVLADEMGLGKTVQTVAFINWLRHVRKQEGPFIVVVPLSTMPAWAETFDNWTPDLHYVVYNGNESARSIIREYELLVNGDPKKPKFNVLLTTYEYVLLDSGFLGQIPWQFLAVDEAHRLKNRESQLYAKLVEFGAPSRLLITGTPIQNNLAELSALMDFLNPGLVAIDADMDLNSEAASSKLAELTDAIQPFILRRTKTKVETDLPPKTERIIRVELADIQLEWYKAILTKNYAALNEGGRGHKQSLLNIIMELKKASNHPLMFVNAESKILGENARREDRARAVITSSGKMMVLDKLLTKLKADGHRVLIFSQMVKMLDLLAEYMEYRGFTFQRLDGTIAAGPRRLAIDHFNAPDSNDFAFILSTRAGGLGINLMTADTVILFDSDWNPQADLQAMARAHRIGQTRPVSVYRLVSKDTIEEEVLERARNKLLLEFITIQRGVTDKEASELQSKMARAVGEPSGTDDISRILKRRGQKMFEQTGNQKKLEQLDIDSVLADAELHQTEQAESLQADGGEEFLKAFEFVDIKVDDLSWDDIIPKDKLQEIKEEEKRKADERYLAEVIEQNQPRKRNLPADERDEREERKAKRRARAQVNADAEESDSADADPKRPLVEKEYRNLLRAFLRYGDIDDCPEELLREARLEGRDKDTVRAALREVTDKAAALVKEDTEKLEAMEQEGKVPTKKEKKAVLFESHGVKRLNAYTIVERPAEMRMIREITSAVSDPKSFRIPEASKKADYSCPWGAREDGMLCIGIARHGYGAWTQIRDDPDLALGDKFFLEEHRVDKKTERANAPDKATKSPGAVHLVRRADYLLSVLKDKLSNGSSVVAKKAVENHHRIKKGLGSRQQAGNSVSASPAPSNTRKLQRDGDRSRQRSQTHGVRDSVERANTPKSDARPKVGPTMDKVRKRPIHNGTHDESHRRRSNSNGVSSKEGMEDLFFKPIRNHLEKVSGVTKANYPNKAARARELRSLIRKIGDFIKSTLEGQSVDGLEDRLW